MIVLGIIAVALVISSVVPLGINMATFPVLLLIAVFHSSLLVTTTLVYPLGIPFAVVKVVSARTYVPLIKATV